MKREYLTRRAPDIEEVAAYMTAIEELGGEIISITTEGTEKYPEALMPHTTYRVWAMVPEGSIGDIDRRYSFLMYGDEEEE